MRIHTFPPYAFNLMGRREYQQDSLYAGEETRGSDGHFYIVCDGVGGCEHGELASETVTARLASILDDVDWEKPFTPAHFGEALAMACATLDKVAEGVDTGTTLTLLCLHAGGCLMAHIGDSRLYHLRPGVGIVYRSEDHSLVSDLVRGGKISAEAALTHPDRNVITRCMEPRRGRPHDRATVRTTNDVKAGDIFMLCSDGVSDEIDDATLSELLLAPEPMEEKFSNLEALCEDASDNATAIVVEVSSVDDAEEPIADMVVETPPSGEDVQRVSLWTRLKQLFKL